MFTNIRSNVRNSYVPKETTQNAMLLTAPLLAPCASVSFPRTRSDTETKQDSIRLFWSVFANILFTNIRTRKVLVDVPIQHGAFTPALSHANSPMSSVFKLKLCIWLSLFQSLQYHIHWKFIFLSNQAEVGQLILKLSPASHYVHSEMVWLQKSRFPRGDEWKWAPNAH